MAYITIITKVIVIANSTTTARAKYYETYLYS